jgi:hypothetical protein
MDVGKLRKYKYMQGAVKPKTFYIRGAIDLNSELLNYNLTSSGI